MRQEDLNFIDKVSRAVCTIEGTTLKDLNGVSRLKEIVYTRHIARYILREYGRFKYQTITKFTGCSSHCTVVHSCKLMKDEMDVDPLLTKRVAAVLALLKITPATDVVEDGKYPFVGVIESTPTNSTLMISPLPNAYSDRAIKFKHSGGNEYQLFKEGSRVYLEFALQSIKTLSDWSTELHIKTIYAI